MISSHSIRIGAAQDLVLTGKSFPDSNARINLEKVRPSNEFGDFSMNFFTFLMARIALL